MFNFNETLPSGIPIYTRIFNTVYPGLSNYVIDYRKKEFNSDKFSKSIDLLISLANPRYYKRGGEKVLIKDFYVISNYTGKRGKTYGIYSLEELVTECSNKGSIPILIPGNDESSGRGFNSMMTFAINNTSKYKKEAFKLCEYLAENTISVSSSKVRFNKFLQDTELASDLAKTAENLITGLTQVKYEEIELLTMDDFKNIINKDVTKQELMERVGNKVWLYLNE